MKKLFGTDGIRGSAGSYPLDQDTVTRVGAALAQTLRAHGPREAVPRILLGRDTRESGAWIERAVAAGIALGGGECVSAGVIPTPGVAYLTRSLGLAAGVMLSASHNPYRDNGIKIFSETGYKLADSEEAEIEAMVLEGNPSMTVAGQPGRPEEQGDPALAGKYAAFLLESVAPGTPFSGLSAVIDCANGAACEIAPRLFRQLGARVETLSSEPDGRNINSGCGTLHPERLAAAVVDGRADLGIAFDGDADRCLLVGGDGRVADGDVLIFQAASDLKRRGALRGDMVVTTVMSNLWLEQALADLGIKMSRTQVGDKYVLEEMLRTGAVLGGEQSGHIIFTDRATTGDGILTALRLVEILRHTGETVSDWLARVKAFPQILLNVRVRTRPDLETHPVIGVEAQRVRSELGESGRLVLRYSGTEALARVMIEATDSHQVASLGRHLAEVIRREIGAEEPSA
ncbi:MAG TPA: phosphoglucosamine mutase [Candidatus Polarisedimenticolia bacterium]|nr:phosphoglucosamine mutase [Candidatus Polarisedimenticolia bacterium]